MIHSSLSHPIYWTDQKCLAFFFQPNGQRPRNNLGLAWVRDGQLPRPFLQLLTNFAAAHLANKHINPYINQCMIFYYIFSLILHCLYCNCYYYCCFYGWRCTVYLLAIINDLNSWPERPISVDCLPTSNQTNQSKQ